MLLADLRYFRAIAEAGSIAKAAVVTGLSQPALTKAMQRLEAALQARLFTRTAKGMVLTEIGVAFRERVRGAELAIEDALHEVRDMRQGYAGWVRFGMGNGLSRELLTAVCLKARKALPRVKLQVIGGVPLELLDTLRKGEVEFFVSREPQRVDSDLEATPLFPDHLVFVARFGHPLHRRTGLKLADLVAYDFVLPGTGNSVTRQWMTQVFHRRKLDVPEPVIETTAHGLALQVIQHSDSIGVLQSAGLSARDLATTIRRLPVTDASLEDKMVSIISRRGGYISPAGARIMRLFREEAARKKG